MSTGHCSTHAPQDVHDHSTSGSMTAPPDGIDGSPSVAPTSSRSASALTASGSESRLDSSARRYGAFANAWSRRFMISSFGDSGFSVFHAGHCDWQRPHSVQVAKSSMPFHEKSSILPMPRLASSSRSSIFSKSIGSPLTMSGLTSPSATPLRLNITFSGAKKMCRCLELSTMIKNVSITPMWISSPTCSSTSFAFSPSGSSSDATPWDMNAALP